MVRIFNAGNAGNTVCQMKYIDKKINSVWTDRADKLLCENNPLTLGPLPTLRKRAQGEGWKQVFILERRQNISTAVNGENTRLQQDWRERSESWWGWKVSLTSCLSSICQSDQHQLLNFPLRACQY
ncbi:hypothetical protein Hamer_G029870 [Homarus americanus]|uniref:Uncharacterized protein n=1 Tax=Homarus americanus TaxID=6706 RepID=A0A8J5JRH0_HOMAM|nr:hypothetical protein Hamer_G029870 [Homarus americanus]